MFGRTDTPPKGPAGPPDGPDGPPNSQDSPLNVLDGPPNIPDGSTNVLDGPPNDPDGLPSGPAGGAGDWRPDWRTDQTRLDQSTLATPTTTVIVSKFRSRVKHNSLCLVQM